MNISRLTTFVLMAALCGLLSFAGSVPQAGDPGVRLRAAIEKEEVDGDLQGAIDLYKKIVAHNGGNRAVAAKALLRLGGCYEKLGQEEARKIYQELVADYPEQQQEVAAARQRLAAITNLFSRESRGMTVRMLWSGPPNADTSGEVSPDGLYLSYMSGDTGDLAVRDLKTGEERLLTHKGGWDKSGDFAFGSRWSPDGKRIVYAWFIQPYQKKSEQAWELRIIDPTTKDSLPHVLNRGSKALIPAGWFPNGTSILAAAKEKGTDGEIVRVSADDGAVQALRRIKWPSGAPGVRLSPDGKYVAYESPADSSSLNTDIFLLPVAGGSEIPLVTGPYDDRLLAWTPDGRHILFSSDRSGTYDAWLVRVEDGRASGTPELVKQDFGTVLPIGFAPGGDFYFGREVIMHDILVADWDAKTGKLASPARKATEHFAGSTYWPAWSHDGKKLAYIVHRGALYRTATNQVCIRDLETGQESTVPKVAGRITSLSWSPDGRSLLLCGQPQAGKNGCWVVDANSGNVLLEAAVPQGEQNPSRGAVWAPDGSVVYYSTWVTNEGHGRIVRRDLASGDEKILYSLDRFHNPIVLAVSPDGRFLAFVLEALLEGNKALGPRIMLLPTGRGNVRELVRSEQHDIGSGTIAWSPDSRNVYFARRAPDAKTNRLCRVAVSDGALEELQFEAKELFELRLSPDGRQIAFVQFSKAHGEIWVMENFLPKDAKASQ
jgi:Tol biopolymer transport system component